MINKEVKEMTDKNKTETKKIVSKEDQKKKDKFYEDLAVAIFNKSKNTINKST